MTAFSIPAISKPFLIASGLFRLTSVALLYRKIFGPFKISDSFIFGQFFCPEFFASNVAFPALWELTGVLIRLTESNNTVSFLLLIFFGIFCTKRWPSFLEGEGGALPKPRHCYIASSKNEENWENSRQLWKPSSACRVCITFEKFLNTEKVLLLW